jgi:hypothetical protein
MTVTDEEQQTAINRLLELAKSRITTIDGEWGCCHTYQEALTLTRERLYGDDDEIDLTITCPMHDEALELAEIERVLVAAPDPTGGTE